MLVAAYLLKGRAIAAAGEAGGRKEDEAREYEGAEEKADALAQYAATRGNPKLQATAERMKADIQMARRQWEGAR